MFGPSSSNKNRCNDVRLLMMVFFSFLARMNDKNYCELQWNLSFVPSEGPVVIARSTYQYVTMLGFFTYIYL